MAVVYELNYRLSGAGSWLTIADDLASVLYDWDSSIVADGSYEARVRARDTSDDAVSPWSVTLTFTIEHPTPSTDPTADVQLEVIEGQYRVGAGAWTPIPGLMRLSNDRFTWDTSAFASGVTLGVRIRRLRLNTGEYSLWSDTLTLNVVHPTPAPVVFAGSLAPLRGITSSERAALLSRETPTQSQLRVRDVNGNWVYITDLAGDNYLISAEVSDSKDSPVITATFTLHRELRGDDGVMRSLAPFVDTSPHNAAGALIRNGAEAELRTVTLPYGSVITEDSWATVWAGYLDDPEWGHETLTVPGRSGARRAQNASIVEAKVYGSDAGTPLSDVLRQKLADNALSNVPLTVVGNPDWFMRPAEQSPGPSVMEAMISDALAIGWLVSDRWTGRNTSSLTLYEPLREAIVDSLTADLTLGPDDYTQVESFRTNTDGVRNIVFVSYLTSSGSLVRYKATDEDSIAKYGPRSMQLAYDAATNINTHERAAALGSYAIHDLAEPATEVQIELRYFWALQRGDIIELLPNGVHDSDARKYAVTDVKHVLNRSVLSTVVNLSTRSAGTPKVWLDRIVTPGSVGSGMGGNGAPTSPANMAPAVTTLRIEQVGANDKTVTLRVRGEVRRGEDMLVSEPNVRLYALTDVAAPLDGPPLGEEAPSGTIWTFARGLVPGQASFETVRVGASNDADHHTIPEMGADTSGGPLRCEAVLVPSLTTVSTITVDVVATDDNHPGARVRITADPLGLGVPLSPVTIAGPSPLTQRFTVDRPDYGNPTARPRWIATAENDDGTPRKGMIRDVDTIDVPPVVLDVARVTTVIIQITDATETLIEYTVTAKVTRNGFPAPGDPQVRLVGLEGDAELFFGPPAGTWSASGTKWKVTRPPAGWPGRVQFESELDGAIGDIDFSIVPEQGVEVGPGTTTLSTQAVFVAGGTNAVQCEIDVTVTDRLNPGARVALDVDLDTAPGVAPTGIAYGASPFTRRFTIPRPAYNAGPLRPRFMGYPVNADNTARSGVLPDPEGVVIPPRAQAVALVATVARMTDQSADWVEYTVTSTAELGTPQVELVSISGDATRTTGAVAGTKVASGSVWRFARGDTPSEALFRGTLAGYTGDDDTALIPEKGSTSFIALEMSAASQSSTNAQMVFRVTVNDPLPQGANTITLAVAATGCTVSPSTPQTISPGGYVDYTITRPVPLSQTGSVLWTATAANRIKDTDSAQVPAQEKSSFGPSLRVVATPGPTSYSLMLTYDGTAGMNIDGTGWVVAPTEGTPYVVTRNAAGGADKVLTFQAIKDGQTVTQTVLVPAIGAAPFTMPPGSVTVGTETKVTGPGSYISIPIAVTGYSPPITVKVFWQFVAKLWRNGTIEWAGGSLITHYLDSYVANGNASYDGTNAYISMPGLLDDGAAVDGQYSFSASMQITVVTESKAVIVGFYQDSIDFKYSTAI